MGSTSSKPTSDTQHVFAADHPIRFSEGLVNSLQNNPETDSTRAKNIELIIQKRVTSELEKRLATSTSKLSDLSESLSKEPSEEAKPPHHLSLTEKPLLNRIADKLTGSSSKSDELQPEQPKGSSGPDSNAIAKDLEELRKKLNARKKLVEKDAKVEKAKEEVVACLKMHDRRPLDCWKEVETFRAEVARLERSFVDKIV